jgi:type I restriction enzyme M protein
MLDSDTKRRIDTARGLLVGKVPDPKSQVEQITIALIYKFMDDMDAEAEELGGKRKFFSGEYGKFGWAKLMQPGIGGHELLALYADGIAKMPENPGIPALFRDIFKNAYLPYRDPETLKSFLKVINDFTYDHSERLGDAFEYLLSVLGSQGDAGQFRTPRHIIDFIVEILAPRKEESLLDPACGTAGFLISAYKHILRSNTDAKGHSTLTPQQRGEMARNFKGYDISPDMVRLSLVNLYLHGFTDPHIFEYDTLTDTARWNEYADVILANPPFMSPKGGIRPHNRFSIQAKRSEVLFVDYIAEHLTPNGRAGIIVPEGIIFQSQNAYKDLRKMLVENSLVAVISLPAGCFNPYSGVKTSILLLDKSLARKSQTIAFFKVEADGYDLGAQRRPIQKNDLPKVQEELESYLATLRERKDPNDLSLTTALIVPKEKIAANGDYNLSGERYLVGTVTTSSYPLVPLSDVAKVKNGFAFKSDEYVDQGLRVMRIKNVQKGEVIDDDPKFMAKDRKDEFSDFALQAGDILMSLTGNVGRVGRLKQEHEPAVLNQRVAHIQPTDANVCLPEYLFALLNTDKFETDALSGASGVAQANLSSKWVGDYQIPLPPLEIQREIVAEIEGYQNEIKRLESAIQDERTKIQTSIYRIWGGEIHPLAGA